jgi:hypothetical protein
MITVALSQFGIATCVPAQDQLSGYFLALVLKWKVVGGFPEVLGGSVESHELDAVVVELLLFPVQARSVSMVEFEDLHDRAALFQESE